MKYVLLIHQGSTPLPGSAAWDAMSPEAQQQVYADYAALNALPQMTGGLPLGLPEAATTVIVRDGVTHTTSGTVAPGGDTVGGYCIVETDDLVGAIAVAERIPAARLGGRVEIRPVATYW